MNEAKNPFEDDLLKKAENLGAVRIDLAFSKDHNGERNWYNSRQWYLDLGETEEGLNIIKNVIIYEHILNAFKEITDSVPIDFLKDEDIINEPYFVFSNSSQKKIIDLKKITVGANHHFKILDITKILEDSEVKNDINVKDIQKYREGIENNINVSKNSTFIDVQDFLSKCIFENCNYSNSKETQKIKQIVVIPNLSYSNFGSNGIVAFSEELEDSKIKDFLVYFNRFAYYESLKELGVMLVIEAIKSAIAALMSRNMSHNLGSHYLTNTKNYYRRRTIIIDVLQGILDEFQKTLLLADYRGTAHLLQYMQERMDFIATVVSFDRYPLGSLNFKAEFFDVLTNDDCGERHTSKNKKYEKNFLLQYLLQSEKYTRHGHTCDVPPAPSDFGDIRLEILFNGKKYTGLKAVMNEEGQLKMELSKIRLAVPGGIMARHALFTLVENILRNSAKHNEHLKDGLVLTIKLTENKEKKNYTLSFYDNCQTLTNHPKTLSKIIRKFKNLKIIDVKKNNSINKKDKGLKEMLICVLWLLNKDIAHTLYNIQTGKESYEKYLRVVDQSGNLCYEIDLDYYEKYHFIENPSSDSDTITMPSDDMLKIHADYILAKKDYYFTITNDKNNDNKRKLSELFPRFRIIENLNFTDSVEDKSDGCINVIKGELYEDDEEELLSILEKESQDYKLLTNNRDPTEFNSPNNINLQDTDTFDNYKNDSDIIVFFDHLFNGGQTKAIKDLSKVPNALYVDSISGENFTQTLTSPDFLNDRILRMKVVDSALARIVLVDERIWEDQVSNWNDTNSGNESELESWKKIWEETKGMNDSDAVAQKIHDMEEVLFDAMPEEVLSSLEKTRDYIKNKINETLNLKRPSKSDFAQLLATKRNLFIYTMRDNYKDNGVDSFWDLSAKSPDLEEIKNTGYKCHFLSIHLGLVEKYFENNSGKKINDFLDLLNNCFKPKFISIHSGRGNFSPELEKELEAYPFVSLSAIDAALGNSKYLLSELLHNINYYGKGFINHH